MRALQSLICCTLFIFCSPAWANPDTPYHLNFMDIDGQSVSLSQYKGQVVLLNFWATWCPPCIKEMPSMQRLKEHMQGKPFEIVAVNLGESETTISSFMLELDTELNFPVLMDEEGKSFAELGLRALPTSILFDQSGAQISKILGAREWSSEESIKEINVLFKN